MASPIESALRRAIADLSGLKARWALIGGFAISVRSIPRFTKDLDFAVAVASDAEAEDVVHRLRARGYQPAEIIEQEYVERLSGVRLERGDSDVVVDLLFASSGIEDEVVAAATRIEVLPRLPAPVATTGHLIALKILAGRNQDLTDLESLIPGASPADLETARGAVRLIHSRGFNREQDVVGDLEKVISELGR
jgi:Nucleotidyl transferase AbiEii toxin, Type IV TA system